MADILERLKNSSKINGAYPRDIADAIKEIEKLRATTIQQDELMDYLFDTIPNLYDLIATFDNRKEYNQCS